MVTYYSYLSANYATLIARLESKRRLISQKEGVIAVVRADAQTFTVMKVAGTFRLYLRLNTNCSLLTNSSLTCYCLVTG